MFTYTYENAQAKNKSRCSLQAVTNEPEDL